MKMVRLLVIGIVILSGLNEKVYAGDELTEKYNLDLIVERQKTITQLIANFKKSDNQRYKVSIMYTLGKLRAVEAVNFLIENIDYGRADIPNKLNQCSAEPALEALKRIGLPSVKPILNAIKKVKDPADFKLCLLSGALVDIGGADMAIYFLNKELEKNNDEVEQSMLKKAIQLVTLYHNKLRGS